MPKEETCYAYQSKSTWKMLESTLGAREPVFSDWRILPRSQKTLILEASTMVQYHSNICGTNHCSPLNVKFWQPFIKTSKRSLGAACLSVCKSVSSVKFDSQPMNGKQTRPTFSCVVHHLYFKSICCARFCFIYHPYQSPGLSLHRPIYPLLTNCIPRIWTVWTTTVNRSLLFGLRSQRSASHTLLQNEMIEKEIEIIHFIRISPCKISFC